MGARRRRRRAKLARRLAPFLLAALLLASAAYALQAGWVQPPAAPAPPEGDGTLRVHYVDVGQGDAVVWELPDGSLVLYDCGPPAPSAQENPVVRYLADELGRPPGSTLWALVASHGHLDHVGGCEEVLAEYRVEHAMETWYSGADAPQSYLRFQRSLLDEGATLHTLGEVDALVGEVPFAAGSEVPLPQAARDAGMRAEVLWPSSFRHGGWDAIAEASVVVRLAHGDVAFCFQGDVETAQEREMLAAGRAAPCEAYLVGHHGSRHAGSAEWLARLAPRVAVASFGENAYGHPTAEALCRAQQAGAQVHATHRAGNVVLASDGETLTVERGRAETVDYCAPGASYWGAGGQP